MGFEILKPEWGVKRPIRGVLFDMDGLVLDSEKLYCRFWREACIFYGFPMSHEQSLQMRAVSQPVGEATLHRFFGEEADYTAIRNKRIELMDAYLQETGPEVKPGIYELLDYLNANHISTAITSSSPLDWIQRYLTQRNLYHRFDKICSGREVTHGKPAPDIYLYGAASLGLNPDNCLALEDAPAGILSAYRAGTLPVIIPDLDSPSAETLSYCYSRADSLIDIISLIEDSKGLPV